MQNVE